MMGVAGLGGIGKIPELRKRVMFTLAMLAVYRLGVFVSVPGIDVAALRRMFETSAGTLFDMINMFNGGALENFSIFTLGITPYISVSIIMQLLTPSIPALDRLKKEGESGQRIITRYTRYGTVVLALIQGFMIAVGLQKQGIVLRADTWFIVSTMFTLTAGTAFIMWLGEQITERGLGNGTSIIIFAGIVARMPEVLVGTIELARHGDLAPMSVLIMLIFAVLSVAGIIFIERSQRRVPIQYPRRNVGNRVVQAQTQYLPLKLNMAGVIPPIFASAFLVVPATIASLSGFDFMQDWMKYLAPGSWSYELMFVGLIVTFSYFYTAVVFNPTEVAENLKKNGGFVPTVRPGKPTADFLYGILNRLTLWGAVYLAIICVVPQLVYLELGNTSFAQIFGGTAILIAVGVTLDTASQIESYFVSRNYEMFMKSSMKPRSGVGSAGYLRSRLLRR
jgi:preprotein translocase subunit SecY